MRIHLRFISTATQNATNKRTQICRVYHFSPLYSLPRQESRGVGYKAGKSDTPTAEVVTEEICHRVRHNDSTVGKRTSPRKQRTPHQKKGDALENAVNRIEQYLLRITPELSEQDFKFETKKTSNR